MRRYLFITLQRSRLQHQACSFLMSLLLPSSESFSMNFCTGVTELKASIQWGMDIEGRRWAVPFSTVFCERLRMGRNLKSSKTSVNQLAYTTALEGSQVDVA
ncbi:hypothetical protein BDN67DRAFT_816060 [Paxillus ammoniavirescens]|nr:hypothetical protein BDN67DRAFT_816060 [Paxillus ammoniavirescens]